MKAADSICAEIVQDCAEIMPLWCQDCAKIVAWYEMKKETWGYGR
jgi:hypothetical protein